MAIEHSIDFQFISMFEGGSINQGYVPDAAKSKSGVTVAVGFDIGARNENDLQRLGFDQDLIDLLKPYLGLQGIEALRYLKNKPLLISDAQANVINGSVKSKLIANLIHKYDNDSTVAFVDIPAHWQTVIASVEFQYGSVQNKCPSFWRYAIKQDWQESIAELRDFGDRYRTRRNKEADYAERHA